MQNKVSSFSRSFANAQDDVLLSFRMKLFVILNAVKNLSDTDAIDAVRNNRYSVASLLTASLSMTMPLKAFPLGGRWIDRKVKTDEGQIRQNPSSPLRGASPLGEAFQDTSASLRMTMPRRLRRQITDARHD